MKIRLDEVLWMSENGNVALTYSQFDLGAKYKVLTKIRYKLDGGGCNEMWEFYNAFGTYGDALNYAKQICDCGIYR